MRKGVVIALAFIFLLAITASPQESRSEVSAQGTGFFTKDSSGQGVSRTATNTGGLWSDTAITSIGGSQRKVITVLIETLKRISQTLQNPQ